MSTPETIPYRPLGILANCLESLGLQITHTYEDLVFVEHNAFLLQMGERGEDVNLYFNVDSAVEKREEIANMLIEKGKAYNLIFTWIGKYQLTPNEVDKPLQLEFLAGEN